jgi:hypothetical protein
MHRWINSDIYIICTARTRGIIVVFAAKLVDYQKFAKILMTSSSFPVLFDFN